MIASSVSWYVTLAIFSTSLDVNRQSLIDSIRSIGNRSVLVGSRLVEIV